MKDQELAHFVDPSDPAWILQVGCLFAEQSTQEFETPDKLFPSWLVEAALAQQGDLRRILPKQVRTQVERVLLGKYVTLGLEWLQKAGLLAEWLPEVEATVKLGEEAGDLYKDVWDHTKQVVAQAKARPLVRWAALLHDIGKVATRTIAPDGAVHFHRHAEVGAEMFHSLGERLGFDPETKQALYTLILYHLRPNQYSPSWTDSAVRRLAKESGPYLTDLLDLSRADVTSKRPGRKQEVLESVAHLSQRIERLKAADGKPALLPKNIGAAMVTKLKLEASPLIGTLKRQLEQAIISGAIESGRKEEYYLEYVKMLLREFSQKQPL